MKILIYTLLLSGAVFSKCPDYSGQKKLIQLFMEDYEQEQAVLSNLKVMPVCKDGLLTHAEFSMDMLPSTYSLPTKLSFTFKKANSKKESDYQLGNQYWKLNFDSDNTLLNIAYLFTSSPIHIFKLQLVDAFQLMLNAQSKAHAQNNKLAQTTTPQIKLESVPNFKYDYFLIHDSQKNKKSTIRVVDFDGPKRERATRSFYSGRGGIDLYNYDFNRLINHFRDEIDSELNNQVQTAFNTLKEETKGKNFQVRELIHFKHNLFEATPGVDIVGGETVELVYPAGKERLYISLKLRVRFKEKHFRETTNIKITIKDFKVSDLIHLTPEENGFVQVHIPEKPKVFGKVDVDISNDFLNLFVSAIEKTVDPLSKQLRELVTDSIREGLRKDLNKILEASKRPFGKDLMIQDHYSAKVHNKREIVDKIEQKIFKIHLSDSTIQNPIYKNPDTLTWIDYLDLDINTLPEYEDVKLGHDGALWTGTFLSSMALKYSVTQSSDDLEKIELLIDKLNILATINGKGPLARTAIPEDSKWFKLIKNEKQDLTFRKKEIDGKTWHSYQGYQGVSRDQYVGVMTGLINTYMYVGDPQIKEKAKKVYTHLIDYLISVKWLVSEDHPGNLYDTSERRTLPAHYAGSGLHKLTYLLAANIMNPENRTYQRELQKVKSVAKYIWINTFVSCIEPLDEYYSFNLKHTLLLTISNIVENQRLKDHLALSVRMLERYVGHHRNPYFSSIRYFAGNKLGLDLDFQSMRDEIYSDFNGTFYRSHNVSVKPQSELELAKVYYDQRTKAYRLDGTELVRVPTPIPPRHRYQTLDFLWQRNPFRPINMFTPAKGNIAGLGLHIVYWILESKQI